jgi:hypothetical protein
VILTPNTFSFDLPAWQHQGHVILNLTPGTVYGVRVRGIGGSDQYGPWGVAMSLMCTCLCSRDPSGMQYPDDGNEANAQNL